MLFLVPMAWAEPNEVEQQFTRALADFDEGQRIQSTYPNRAKRLFLSSAQRYNSIISAGIDTGPLEYNLGNSYLQVGDLGRAILHYRRAELFIPRDPLLADNLSVARSRRLLSIQSTRSDAFLRSIFFWHYQSSPTGRHYALLLFYLTLWIFLSLRHFIPRKSITVTACVFASLTMITACSLGVSHWTQRIAPAGVIMNMDVVVQKGPGSGYQRQFEQPLQPGVEFTVREKRGRWWNIELPDGKTGWIDADQVELITGNKS